MVYIHETLGGQPSVDMEYGQYNGQEIMVCIDDNMDSMASVYLVEMVTDYLEARIEQKEAIFGVLKNINGIKSLVLIQPQYSLRVNNLCLCLKVAKSCPFP